MVITAVTAVEVYFRDMLHCIFRVCKRQTFEPFLRDFHKAKYNIDELVTLYEKDTHPLELVLDGCNFQNIDVISSVFSKLLGKSLWQSVFNVRLRERDKPETEIQLDNTVLQALQRTCDLRHQLIHDPDFSVTGLTESQRADLYGTIVLVLGCDVVLDTFISDNLDDEFKNKSLGPNRQRPIKKHT